MSWLDYDTATFLILYSGAKTKETRKTFLSALCFIYALLHSELECVNLLPSPLTKSNQLLLKSFAAQVASQTHRPCKTLKPAAGQRRQRHQRSATSFRSWPTACDAIEAWEQRGANAIRWAIPNHERNAYSYIVHMCKFTYAIYILYMHMFI